MLKPMFFAILIRDGFNSRRMKRSVANANIPASSKGRLLERYSSRVKKIDVTDEASDGKDNYAHNIQVR